MKNDFILMKQANRFKFKYETWPIYPYPYHNFNIEHDNVMFLTTSINQILTELETHLLPQ